MKVIIAGSRTITDEQKVWLCISDALSNIIRSIPYQTELKSFEIISGGARGVDSLGEKYAKIWKLKLTKFTADWQKYGKKAGYLRNVEMANYAEVLIAIWDGKSKGTKHMIDIAKKKGLKVYVYRVQGNS